jgi:flagellar biosynthetic protein FliR
VLACLFAAVTSAGAILDTLIGFSFGALVDPMSGMQSGPLVQLYSLVAVMVFIAIGGDAWVIGGLAHTYEVVPLLQTPSLAALTAGAVDAFAGIFGAALAVSAPVLLALVLTDVQLNVFAVGFPVKIVAGLLVIGVSLPFVSGWLSDQLAVSVESALRSLRLA